MYIDLTSNLSNINIYIVLAVVGIGTGYFCGSVSNSYLLVKIAYVITLLITVSHPPTRLFVIGGFVFGYFYSKREGFFDVSDWLNTYRYSRAVKREERERVRRETERRRQEADELNRRREQERQRREEEQRQERAEQERQGQKRQGEQPRSHEQARREEELRKAEEELKRKQDAIEEIMRRAYETGKHHAQAKQTHKDTRTPEEVLGLQPGYTKEELRRAYKAQCQRLHPDKWQDRPPHIQEAMEEEQKRVNWAYGVLGKTNM